MAPTIVRAYQAASALTRITPRPVARAVSRGLGITASVTDRRRRLVVERNLRRAHGRDLGPFELRREVRRTYESYARYWMEAFRLPGLTPGQLDAGMTHDGFEHIEDALADGRGPIMVIPHLGGWEWAAFWLTAVKGLPITAVVERLDPPELYDWFVGLRTSLGMDIVPLGAGAGSAVVRAVRAQHVVCLLSDRDLGGGGVEVEFFGERTTLPAGPATLALRTGARLLPTAVYYRGAGHHGVVHPPVPAEREGNLRADVARITQLLANELEVLIRRAPSQWHLMQPNWPSDHEALERAGLQQAEPT